MAAFKDINGKTWSVELDGPTIKKVRDLLKIDLADPSGKTFLELGADFVNLVDVLYVVCMEQADKANVSDEAFGKALKGDGIEHATEALLNAIEDFFPRAKREMLRAVLDREKALRGKSIAMALERINRPELEEQLLATVGAEMDRAIAGLLTPSSSATPSPAAWESPREDTPSAS